MHRGSIGIRVTEERTGPATAGDECARDTAGAAQLPLLRWCLDSFVSDLLHSI
ncbi:hypothetical protein XOC_2853 [Xanthomonas oryzae pv. oryzicola BLS256]|uniref:Uncharacterized protein n=1 Tax=Xanthomonas oryzae pv. oryzicola (strain BLS256) TaxID=383407 RepID=G7TK27_XANOB|nr:hypothetical protein XOC_2853 [Xanthomonas oryzae pv. oryzicola BLS256]